MQIRLTVPREDVDERTLGAALEAATEIAQRQIEQGAVPPLSQAIAEGVRWQPEDTAPGDESFDPPVVVWERGWGDCDDLGPFWAGELRASGVDPDAQSIAYQSGPKRWHVVVQRGDGSIDDPSRWAGMGSVSGSRIPYTQPMGGPGRTVVGFKRSPRGGVFSRLDVPIIGDSGEGISITRHGEDALHALHRATRALALFALWGAPDDVLARLAALEAALRGEEGDYSEHGGFVSGVHATLDAGKAADLATAFLDPLGLHNMIPGLAQTFVSNYAQGLAQRGSPAATTPAATSTTPKAQPIASGDACPPGHHWEQRGSILVCVPDYVPDVDGAGRTRGGGGRSRTPAGGSSSRTPAGSSSRSTSTTPADSNAPILDPSTGLFQDAATGLYIDPMSGGLLSPDMQWNIDPSTGTYTEPSSFAQQAQQQIPPMMPGMMQQPYQQPFYGGGQPYAPAGSYGVPPGYVPQQYAYGGGGFNPYG